MVEMVKTKTKIMKTYQSREIYMIRKIKIKI